MSRSRPTTDKPPPGGRTIKALISLSEAGRRLGANPRYLKGMAEAIGIRLLPAGNALVMAGEDFERLEAHFRKIRGGPARDDLDITAKSA